MGETVRILHVLNHMDLGGAESRIMDVYRNIDTDRVQFDFAVHVAEKGYFDSEIKDRGGRIYVWPRFGLTTLLRYIKRVNCFFKEHREYSIVHGHITSFGFIYQLIAKKNGVKLRIGHARTSSIDRHLRGYMTLIMIRFLRYFVTDYFSCSIPAGEFTYGRSNIRKGKVRIVNNAIDARKFSFSLAGRQRIRSELGITNSFVIGHVGRLTYAKNHRFLLDIFSEIVDTRNDAVLVLVGEGELREEIGKKAEDLGVNDKIIFAGQRSDIPALLSAMDVLVFPSFYEGLPGAVIEAQAAGLRCLVSDSVAREVGITELVKFISLKKPAKFWAEEVLKNADYVRESQYKTVAAAGFDVRIVAQELQEFYLRSSINKETDPTPGNILMF